MIDLVPDSTKKKRAFVGRTLFMYLSAAAALLFLVLSYLDLSAQADELGKKAKIERRKAGRAKRELEEYRRETDLKRAFRKKRNRLARLTQPAFALQRAQQLVQAAWQDGIWIESIAVKDVAVPVDKAKPRGPKRDKTMIEVRGEIVSVAVQAEGALEELVRAIQERDPGCKVSIANRSGGAASGSRKLSFVLALDFFPDGDGDGAEGDD